jgi:CAAX protease family protein
MSKQTGYGGYLTPVTIILGLCALAVRPPATLAAVVVTAAVGGVGLLAPVPFREEARRSAVVWLAAVLVGVTPFALGRALAVAVPAVVTLPGLLAGILAAVAEEVFFRRLVYGWLVRWGPAAAIAGASAAFAVVHLRGYGPAALPVNLAAGLLFGWQRWATGGWIAPACAHIAANLVQVW